jgi:hypothetical protein
MRADRRASRPGDRAARNQPYEIRPQLPVLTMGFTALQADTDVTKTTARPSHH